MSGVQRMSRAYFEAEFGPVDSTEHTSSIGPSGKGRVPAFLVPGFIPEDHTPDFLVPGFIPEDPT